jgi:hypothetical protein
VERFLQNFTCRTRLASEKLCRKYLSLDKLKVFYKSRSCRRSIYSAHGPGVSGSIPISTTIQSAQTADFQAESKWAVSAGIFAGFVLPFWSPVTLAVS